MDTNPRQYNRWMVERIGSETLDALEFLSNQVTKWNKADMDRLYKSMKAELKDMQAKRAEGETGRIEFEGSKVLNDA